MELNQVKELASRIYDVGVDRVKIVDPEKCRQAITREDVRDLVSSGALKILPIKGQSRARANKLKEKKKKGRRRGHGSRKGPRENKKEKWIKKVRALRRLLREYKDQLPSQEYRKLYLRIRGGFFRDKSHLRLYLEEKKVVE